MGKLCSPLSEDADLSGISEWNFPNGFLMKFDVSQRTKNRYGEN